MRLRPLAVKLASRENGILRPLPQLFRLFKASLLNLHIAFPPQPQNPRKAYDNAASSARDFCNPSLREMP